MRGKLRATRPPEIVYDQEDGKQYQFRYPSKPIQVALIARWIRRYLQVCCPQVLAHAGTLKSTGHGINPFPVRNLSR
jgi:hypothetical protein